MGDKNNEPNVVLPLAASYNTRGIDAYANLSSTLRDQRKINCFYEIADNSLTGKKTLTVSKRPRFIGTADSIGSSSGTPFLIITKPGGANASDPFSPWIFKQASPDIIVGAADSATDATIVTQSGAQPCYVDKTVISGTEYAVLQTRLVSGLSAFPKIRAWYASTYNSWTEITDADFTGIDHRGKIEHLDGFALQLGADNYVYNSDLNSLSSWTAGNKIKKQIAQDAPLGLAKLGGLIISFGVETMEVFYNAGNETGSPLRRRPELSQRVGLAAIAPSTYDTAGNKRHYYATLGNRIYFLGRFSGGDREISVCAFDGQKVEKISSPYIDKILTSGAIDQPGRAKYIGTMNVLGQDAIYIFNDTVSGVANSWLMYFPALNEWFEWASPYMEPVNNGKYFIGIPGTVDELNVMRSDADGWGTDQTFDGSTSAYTMTLQFKIPKKGNNRDFMRWLALEGDTTSGNVTVSVADNDTSTFTSLGTIDLATADKKLSRCGSYKSRHIRLEHSAASACSLRSFLARVD